VKEAFAGKRGFACLFQSRVVAKQNKLKRKGKDSSTHFCVWAVSKQLHLLSDCAAHVSTVQHFNSKSKSIGFLGTF